MIADKERITTGQLMALVIQAQIGVGVLFLPSTVEAVARNDSWISILLAGAVSLLLLTTIWALAKRFPDMIFFEYLPLLIGKPLAKIVHATYALMFIFECGSILALFADVIRNWIFTNTPAWIILGMLVAVSLHLAVENLRLLARFFMLTFGLIFVLVLIALYAYRDAEWLYALPVGQAGLSNILKGSAISLNSFYGFEIILLGFPYVKGASKSILKAGLYSNLFSTAVYVFLVFTCVLVFTPEELRLIPQPVLYMVKSFSFTVIERADLYFLTIWIIVVITTIMAYLYMAAKSVSTLFGKPRHAGTAPVVAVCIWLIALYPHNQDMIDLLQKVVAVLTTATLIVFPPLLLGVAYLRKVERKEQAKG